MQSCDKECDESTHNEEEKILNKDNLYTHLCVHTFLMHLLTYTHADIFAFFKQSHVAQYGLKLKCITKASLEFLTTWPLPLKCW